MLYTLNDRILPVYYRESFYGKYKKIYASAQNALKPHAIDALHYHSFAEIGICLCGSGVTHVENRVYTFGKGDLQFVPPGVAHLSAAEPGVETRWQWISFDVRKVLEEGGFAQIEKYMTLCENGFAGVFHPWEHERLAEIMTRFRDSVLLQDTYSGPEQVFLVGQMITECARIGRERPIGGEQDSYCGKLKPAVLYIRKNFADKESIREHRIAEVCGLSVSHMRALFKRETGLTVQDFIVQTRLARATYLLRNTDSSVSSIAAESGFGQISCFNRIFLRVLGQNPTAFRKQYQQNNQQEKGTEL